MDFAIIDNSLRIKSKTATVFVNPLDKKKTEADIALFTNAGLHFSDARLNVTGPGEYEVSGAKVSAQKLGKDIYFVVEADGLRVGIGKMSQMQENQDKIPPSNISAVNLDSQVNMSSIILSEPSVIVLFGENAKEVKDAEKVSKYSVTFEKLPQETQTILLG